MRFWPGYLPPLLALAASLLATLTFALAGSHPLAAELGSGVVALILVPIPVTVAVVWAAGLVTARPHWLALAGAVAWLAVALPLWGGATTWPLAANVAAGLVGGVALGARWRLDAALAGVTAALLPLTVWTVVQLPVTDQLAAWRTEMISVLEREMPQTADADARQRALAQERERVDAVLELAGRLYPFVLAVGLLAEALLILTLGWVVVRVAGWRLPPWRPPPFTHWRLPFYLVWVLVAGLGLMISRQPLAVTVGMNVALFAAALLSIQGVAVQFFVTARVLKRLGRIVFWSVMGVFFTPLILTSGAVLGLADQWLDLRRLGRGPDPAADDDFGRGGR